MLYCYFKNIIITTAISLINTLCGAHQCQPDTVPCDSASCPTVSSSEDLTSYQMSCEEGYFNDMSALFWCGQVRFLSSPALRVPNTSCKLFIPPLFALEQWNCLHLAPVVTLTFETASCAHRFCDVHCRRWPSSTCFMTKLSSPTRRWCISSWFTSSWLCGRMERLSHPLRSSHVFCLAVLLGAYLGSS